MTSTTTGDRSRWGTTRRSGMTILGKVAVPKPINLPSQRLENQGLDPNVEIVPKGTLSWGSKSSLNAWGTSSLSPRTESGPGSPSHLSNRPSSGGSVTRPSTADSNKAHESSSVVWDSNSRPSSASGVFPSNQASVALQRPHSADTRPGSSQLSRFAEAVSDTSATWGVPTKNDGFSLTAGDFPSLGADKESSEKSTKPQDAGPQARPASTSGRSVEERGVDCTEEANERIGDVNSWRRDNQPYSEDAPRDCREEGQLDSRGSHSYPNANFPHQYDAWRGPPVNNPQGGGWYRGNHPYGAPMGPGAFHMDPLTFYSPQVPPAPGHGVGPRGNHTTNEKMFRPPILDSYVHPRMQTRPPLYLGPVPYEGYYGPHMAYGNPNNRALPFAGRPAGPHAYNNHSGQGGYDTTGSSVSLERNEPSHSQETQRPYKVLLKPQDGRFGGDEAKREEFLGNRLPNAEKVSQQMQTSRNERRENRNETSGEAQPTKAENAAPINLSLIQKIEGLNAKTRINDGWQNASSGVNSGNSVNRASARNPRTGHASDSKNPLHYGDPATNKNTELAAMSGPAISRRPTQQTQGRADLQTKGRVNSEGNDGWRRTTVMSGSSRATLATNSETFPEVNVGDSLDTDSIRRPGSGISADPNDNQRSMMRELARQRAQQRQKEEEERARVQRATALAKLEELNRRSQTEQIAAKNQTTSKDDGWNDGWYMTPETHYPTAEEMEASAAGKDQGMSIHGKQHASRSNKDGGSNYGDPKKANKRDPNKAHMQHSVHGLSQPDIPVTSKESRGPGDHVWHTSNTTGKYGGRENTREKSYGSQKKDVAGYEHQGFSTEQKKTSADTHGQLQNPNSMFPKNTGQSRRFGRGQESQGGRCGSPVQENMHLHHQRPGSNRDRQKQNTMHYEYKPVGSHTNDGERNREQLKDNTQTEGPRYREKGHGQQRHGGYQQQRGTSGGRNTGHGLAGERN